MNFIEVTKAGVAKSKNHDSKKKQLTKIREKKKYHTSNCYQNEPCILIKYLDLSDIDCKEIISIRCKGTVVQCKDDSYQNTRDQRTRSTSNSQFCLVIHKSEDLTIQRRMMTG